MSETILFMDNLTRRLEMSKDKEKQKTKKKDKTTPETDLTNQTQKSVYIASGDDIPDPRGPNGLSAQQK